MIGIVLGESEHVIGQPWDDTELFLDGSATSLNEAPGTRSNFCRMSGLKMDIDETKAIKELTLGSDCSLCSLWTLDWHNADFDVPGIKVNADLKKKIRMETTKRIR